MVGEQRPEVTCEIHDTAMSGTKIPRSRPAWDNSHCKDPLSSGTLVGARDTDVGSHLTRGEFWAKELQHARRQNSVRAQLPEEAPRIQSGHSGRALSTVDPSREPQAGWITARWHSAPQRVVSDESCPLSESVSPSRKGGKIPSLTHVIGLLVGSTETCRTPPSPSC